MPASLDELVFSYLEQIEEPDSNPDAVQAAFEREHPSQAREFRERVEALKGVGLISSPIEESPIPERMGDFDLERKIGGGGMGIVYLARQRSVDRLVALKLVRPGLLFQPETKTRFRREAAAAAHLSHPNIVQVYAFGEEGDIPFLAMEYLDGLSLDQLIAAFREPNAPESGSDLLELLHERSSVPRTGEIDSAFFDGSVHDVCLRIAGRVAQALAHAHDRGVMHRDVKPSNVILTPSGRVVLLDFGLASLVGAESVTRTGSQLGSLPYMAPEHLDGTQGPSDARSDVYGLGVTLYELLTLERPFLVADSYELTRADIIGGRPRALRQIDRTISIDAETVCLAAMDREPGRRYASARLLWADLENLAAGQPIAARPLSTGAQLWRWARRNRAMALAAALTALLFIGGPTIFGLQAKSAAARLKTEAERADHHRDAAVEALRVADLNHRATQSALERSRRNYERSVAALELVTRIAIEDLEDVPMAEEGRAEVLHGVAGFYGELTAEPESTPATERERGVAMVQLARVRMSLDELAAAEELLLEALAIFADLAAAGEMDKDVGRAHWYLARIAERKGDTAKAQAHFEGALAQVRPGDPSVDSEALDHAWIRSELAMLWRRSGDLEAAGAEFRKLTAELEEHPIDQNDRLAALTSFCYGELAAMDARLGQESRRIPSLERALEINASLAAKAPGRRFPKQKWMLALSNLGGVWVQEGEGKIALPYLEQARALAEELAADFPGLPEYRFNLSGVLTNLGGSYVLDDLQSHLPDADARAHECLSTAIQITSRLVAEDPVDLRYATHLAGARSNFAALLIRSRAYAEALDVLELSDETLAGLAPRLGGDIHILRAQRVNTLNRMRGHLGLGQVAAACEAAQLIYGCGDPYVLSEGARMLGLVLASEEESIDHQAQSYETMVDLMERALAAGYDRELFLQEERFAVLQGDERLEAR